jgi:NADH-quinone oxidoreductase subunit N
VNFYDLVQYVVDDTVQTSLWAFRPELVLVATIVVLLLVRMLDRRARVHAFYITVIGTGVSLYLAAPWLYLGPHGLGQSTELFTGMLVFDTFSVQMRSFLLFFALLFATFTQTTGFPDRDDSTDFFVMILGSILGMCLMVSANHMLIVFLGIEMASVPSYALAGALKGRRQSSEAALKFAVYGAGSAGVMLYGISLLVGVLGTAHLPTMALQLADLLQSGAGVDRLLVLVLGGLMVMVGLAFKISAVPFHFWAPDVFEGAAAEVAAFLSIASKAAALALLVRVGLGLGATTDPAALEALAPVREYIVGLIAVLATITCTFGNLAAYGQTNMKRLLAYSTIAHAGYMMMPVAAAVALAGTDAFEARGAVASLVFYIGIYLFMNLGAFAVVAFLRNRIASEELEDYAGLIGRSPGLAVCLAILMFSLVGLPPLAGFAAKFTIFAAVYEAGLLALLLVGVLNTALSLFYYLRVVKVVAFDAEREGRPAPRVPLTSVAGAYCLVLTVPVVLLGIWWNGLFNWAQAAALTMLM